MPGMNGKKHAMMSNNGLNRFTSTSEARQCLGRIFVCSAKWRHF